MAIVSITRDKTLPHMSRGEVPVGALFSIVKRDGSLGDRVYAHVGFSLAGTEAFSVRLDNEAVAQSSSLDRVVALVGSYKMRVSPRNVEDYTSKSRGEVSVGEVFFVPNSRSMRNGKPVVYGHIGVDDKDRQVSLNFSTWDYATSENTNSEVVVIGDFKMDATKV